ILRRVIAGFTSLIVTRMPFIMALLQTIHSLGSALAGLAEQPTCHSFLDTKNTNQERGRTMPTIYVKERKHYGFLNFVGDVIMTVITAGFWLIWVFVREVRRAR